MLNRVAFVSALTEGLTTVIPMQIDEIETVYHIVDDYLQENFPGFSTELSHEENDENTKINITEDGQVSFSLSFIDAKIFILSDEDFLPTTELASSIYGILMILSTFLIIRLNNFSFTSKEIPLGENTDDEEGDIVFSGFASIDPDFDKTYKKEETSEKDTEIKEKIDLDEEEESSFDDEYI